VILTIQQHNQSDVWLADESQAERVRAELARFLENPADPRYLAPASRRAITARAPISPRFPFLPPRVIPRARARGGVFPLGGFLNGVFAKTFDDISLVPTFVLTPLTYLGGVFYSLTLLPPFWQGLSHLNPIVYMISGFRYGFLGINDVPLVTTFGVLVVFIVAFYLICWSLIQRGRGLRS
ncbi:ABC transporter permease, partial [Escherichia coli]